MTAGWGEARRCSRQRWVRETRRKSGGCVGRTAGCAGLASREGNNGGDSPRGAVRMEVVAWGERREENFNH